VPLVPFTVRPTTLLTVGVMVFWAVEVGAWRIHVIQVLADPAFTAYTALPIRRIGSISPSGVQLEKGVQLEVVLAPPAMFVDSHSTGWLRSIPTKVVIEPKFTEK